VTNTYKITADPVGIDGVKLDGETSSEFYKKIDSNYKFWEALGGINSVSKVNGLLTAGEGSIYKVAQVANRVGVRLVNGEITS